MRRLAALALALACAGCSGWQSALDPHGSQALGLEHLIRFIVAVCAGVWLLVMMLLAAALLRRRARTATSGGSRSERGLTISVSLGVAATVVIIAVLTIASFIATRGLASSKEEPLVVRVRGLQWWWEIRYLATEPDQGFLTANEIHVPVGRPVRLELEAADVIHSFWVPSLAGKLDLIPGRENILSFTTLRPGVYRGQCAEFCGMQHAHMALLVIAEEPGAFAAWRRAQLASPAEPASPEQVQGRRLFLEKACANCHSVRGTPASGTVGPDLTHIGSRRYIAAGLLETTRGSLAAWIADPQTLKPGSNMPMVSLSADDLNAISAYLASLK